MNKEQQQKTIAKSTYMTRTFAKLVEMRDNLVMTGMTNEEAYKRIVKDLKRGGSVITPAFVRMALDE